MFGSAAGTAALQFLPPRRRRLQIHNLHAFLGGPATVEFAQAFCRRSDFPIAYNFTVHFGHASELAHCAGAKDFVRAMDSVKGQVCFFARNFSASQISRTVARVIPSGQATTRLVASSPRRTMKMWVAFVSAMFPF